MTIFVIIIYFYMIIINPIGEDLSVFPSENFNDASTNPTAPSSVRAKSFFFSCMIINETHVLWGRNTHVLL
jgi:hypothetical protein